KPAARRTGRNRSCRRGTRRRWTKTRPRRWRSRNGSERMASRITGLVLDCHDPDRLAEFWCAALGYEVIGLEPDGLELGVPGARLGDGPPTLVLARSENPRRGKLPLHIDVNPAGSD